MNHETFDPEQIADAKAHAREAYPEEAVGFFTKTGGYLRVKNIHATPTEKFKTSPEAFIQADMRFDVTAIIHSHPDGPFFPSQDDMQGQIDTNLPWGIIATDGDRVSDPFMWGDSLPIAPLIGREFMHGIWDCYAIIRDTYRLGKEGMAAQDMPDWPFDPIVLPEVPRDDNWWSKDEDDHYQNHFAKFGFREIPMSDVQIGDIFLMKVKSHKMNHGGVYVGNNLILHHLPARLSRREPCGMWARHAEKWIRYEGKPDA